MKIIIDATNLKVGGGLTHLKQLLKNFNNDTLKIEVIGGEWIKQVVSKKNIKKTVLIKEFSSLIRQELFKLLKLEKYLGKGNIAFIPGGRFSSVKTPYVTMCRNMLVFENIERNRYPVSFIWLRLLLLERLQVKSFGNAKGIIYISEYAKNYIENKYPKLKEKKATIIYHGISDNFRAIPKPQKSIETYSQQKPYRLLYVSIIDFYKHQWNVVKAVKRLREEGFPITLDLVGAIYEPIRYQFERSLEGTSEYVNYRGKVEYEEISEIYKKTDAFIFASTCENMPNILVEAMSAGLPILSSNYGPMPEILKDAGEYMNPLDANDIYKQLKYLLLNPKRREEIAKKAYNYSQNYSWEKTAEKTFHFIKELAIE